MPMFDQDPRQAREFFAQRLLYTAGPCDIDGRTRRKELITVVDVRRAADYREGHVAGAISLPQGRWHTLAGLSKDRLTIVYGYDQNCRLATAAAVEFASAGYAVMEMEGGFAAWRAAGRDVETLDASEPPVDAGRVG